MLVGLYLKLRTLYQWLHTFEEESVTLNLTLIAPREVNDAHTQNLSVV